MQDNLLLCREDAECQVLGTFLDDRIYEFNAKVTGYVDGRLLAGCVRDEAGAIIAGFNGYTWGGCCELSNVWVREQHRGRGLGTLLLRSAEIEAAACSRRTAFKLPAFTSAWATSESTRSRAVRAVTRT